MAGVDTLKINIIKMNKYEKVGLVKISVALVKIH
jgi:hypothetical protein